VRHAAESGEEVIILYVVYAKNTNLVFREKMRWGGRTEDNKGAERTGGQ
jgi:hypothetical protein